METAPARKAIKTELFIIFLVEVVSACTNTDPTVSHVKAIQVRPITNMVDTQVEVPVMERSMQTEKLETTTSSTVPFDRRKKSSTLEVQILPKINIPGALVVQKTLAFSINQQGNTELAFKADTPNVLFVELTPSEDSIGQLPLVDYNNSFEVIPTVCNLKESMRINDEHECVSTRDLYHFHANTTEEKTDDLNSSDQENNLEKKDR